jgi:uncharacterized protein
MAAYRQCHRDPRIEAVPFQADFARAAVDLYEARHDKAWGVTDCLSFIVMENRHLPCRHPPLIAISKQAGFEALLLREPQEG